MRIKKAIILLPLLLVTFSICGQPIRNPKKIKAKETYQHSPTRSVFPVTLFTDYQRASIYAYDKKKQNISVTYQKKLNGEETTFSLYLYPAGDAFEGRLRSEYINSMQSAVATTEKGLHAKQSAVQHQGSKYICNGFKAIFTDKENNLSQLSLFESGVWFYKIRITTNQADTVYMSTIESKILQNFDPTHLTDLTHLDEMVSIYYGESAFRDTVLLGSAMGSAYRKIEWIMENVAENERATAFPDLYLDLHVEGLKAFMEFQHRIKATKSKYTEDYLKELQLIADANFLSEFVMDQYGMILIIPENTPYRYDEYLQWKEENNVSINLDEKFYILSFDAKK